MRGRSHCLKRPSVLRIILFVAHLKIHLTFLAIPLYEQLGFAFLVVSHLLDFPSSAGSDGHTVFSGMHRVPPMDCCPKVTSSFRRNDDVCTASWFCISPTGWGLGEGLSSHSLRIHRHGMASVGARVHFF